MPGITFLEEEYKQLVQLARAYTDQGVHVAWNQVANMMHRWKRRPKELEQRLNSLKRTFGKDLAAFPPSFFATVQGTRGRRSRLVQRIRRPAPVSCGEREMLCLAATNSTVPQLTTELSYQPADTREAGMIPSRHDLSESTIAVASMNMLMVGEEESLLTGKVSVDIPCSMVESVSEPLPCIHVNNQEHTKILSPCSAARVIWTTFESISRNIVAYPSSAPRLNAGELLPTAVSKLVSAISSINRITQDDSFLDIGFGVGNVLAQFALETAIGASIGIELFPADVRHLDISMITPFASATIVFANNVRYEPTTNNHIYDEVFFMVKAWIAVLTSEVCSRHNGACAKDFCCRWELKPVLLVCVSWPKQTNLYIYTERI
ncbi:hypothetical protein JG688_00012900 [Phytophthora aleatoria]|uniref:DOT1 domain-containing protein n=1 Tax=Phytophthora aleatoria TaxID=2496075 RepID=A0A8J5IXZ8_9STRA|nr:hypothetical protein JG688_00012900 [Phytophthora aleatoria]